MRLGAVAVIVDVGNCTTVVVAHLVEDFVSRYHAYGILDYKYDSITCHDDNNTTRWVTWWGVLRSFEGR